MKPLRAAILAVLGAFLILTLTFVALATPSAGFANRACLACHVVRIQGQALDQSSHRGTPCLGCHQKRGIFGAMESVFDGATNLAYWANPFQGPSAAKSSVVESGACLTCHKRIVRTADVIDSDFVVDHRHFNREKISCMECHRGVAHGEKLVKGGGMAKQLCLGCHNGIDASQECALCHKKEVKGVRPQDKNTALGVAHDKKNWKKTHALASLKTCSLCHAPNDCRKCHGVGLPHDSNFIYRHGKIVTGKIRENPLANGSEPSPFDKGRQLFETKCQICHGLDRPRNAPYQGDEWKTLVGRMRGKGAPATDEEADLVASYLAASRGGNDNSAGGGSGAGSAKEGTATDAVIRKPIAAVTAACLNCHKRSYCYDCHGKTDMPHRSKWLRLHEKQTTEKQIPTCFRCHVNEECIGCHQAHKSKVLQFPSGPTGRGLYRED